jgi:hypothetical protein
LTFNVLLKRVPLIGIISSMVVLLLSFIAQFTGTYELVAYTDPFLFRDDKVSMYEDRFADLKPWLDGHDQVGYISDSDELEERLLLQYVVAPVIVLRSSDCCDLIIGNFLDPDYEGYTRFDNLRPIQRFPGNVILFEYLGD